jgi:hypothetical protein
MNRQNISQIIRSLFRDNYRLYPETYPNNIGPAIDAAKETAKGYWDNRTPEEEQRDAEAHVTLQDYEKWCVDELRLIKKEAINN